jgi:CRISPR system Cascade subunit CasA
MLNLISDPWIPVRTRNGSAIIRPDQIADRDVLFPDWPRPDLNMACLEFLIGLLFMACPPESTEDWDERRIPDGDFLHERLSAYAKAFHLTGDGPRFLQDLEAFEGNGDPNPVDMLFIDSSGGNTARNNADLMVHRGRYPSLSLPEAAIALYALQAFAPSGGAGNRTSMRGGGPLTTLVVPSEGCSLYELVWANVPDGIPARPEDLPWMRPTQISSAKDAATYPTKNGTPVETFFGMPRRFRLIFEGQTATGVVQRPYGTNYALWEHPLTPYYQLKAGTEKLPVHPRAGVFGYRNWQGILCEGDSPNGLRQRAKALQTYTGRVRKSEYLKAKVLVAGWAMDNMKPRDFTWSIQPMVELETAQATTLRSMIQVAELYASELRSRLKPVLGEKSALENTIETFYQQTETSFQACFAKLQQGAAVAAPWVADLKRVALRLYDTAALNSFDQRDAEAIEAITTGRSYLLAAFAGINKTGKAAFDKLQLPLPARKEKTKP